MAEAYATSQGAVTLGLRCVRLRRLGVSVLVFACMPSFALAQLDAGALRQQIESASPRSLPGEVFAPAATVVETEPVKGMSVSVKTFRFVGNTLLSDARLAEAVHPYTGRALDLNGLRQAAAAVGEAYRRAGLLARAYLPRQEITGGVITIDVVEARFGALRRDGASPAHVSETKIDRYFTAAQGKGKALKTTSLDRALLLVGDLAGVAVAGHLAPGKTQGETDLVLQYANLNPYYGELSVDNMGSDSTGANRAVAKLVLNSPFGIGDSATFDVIDTNGEGYGRLGYRLPVGYDGLTLGANVSTLGYRVVNSAFSALAIRGYSNTWGIDAQYPIVRARSRNLYVKLAYAANTYDNQTNTITSSHYQVRDLSVAVSGNSFDKLGGGGANFVSFTLTRGSVNLGSLDIGENPALAGQFYKLNFQASRQQSLGSRWSLYVLMSGQLADRNLDSSEKFYLGGANGVRAYPASEAGGSDGFLVNAELRYRLRPDLTLTAFYDGGWIAQNHNNNVSAPARPNIYGLQGAGLSVTWNAPHNLQLKAAYAHRLGRNPNSLANGNDQSGTLIRDRLWLSVNTQF